MPIRKRLTEEQRIKRQLPKGWRAAIKHPLIARQCFNGEPFDPTPANVVKAINATKGWKGASWAEKVFVISLDLVMEKAYGVGILDAETYNRLQEHLVNNDHKIYAAEWRVWHVFTWDIYHDAFKLQDMEPGQLILPRILKPKRKLKRKPVLKRRKLIKSK